MADMIVYRRTEQSDEMVDRSKVYDCFLTYSTEREAGTCALELIAKIREKGRQICLRTLSKLDSDEEEMLDGAANNITRNNNLNLMYCLNTLDIEGIVYDNDFSEIEHQTREQFQLDVSLQENESYQHDGYLLVESFTEKGLVGRLTLLDVESIVYENDLTDIDDESCLGPSAEGISEQCTASVMKPPDCTTDMSYKDHKQCSQLYMSDSRLGGVKSLSVGYVSIRSSTEKDYSSCAEVSAERTYERDVSTETTNCDCTAKNGYTEQQEYCKLCSAEARQYHFKPQSIGYLSVRSCGENGDWHFIETNLKQMDEIEVPDGKVALNEQTRREGCITCKVGEWLQRHHFGETDRGNRSFTHPDINETPKYNISELLVTQNNIKRGCERLEMHHALPKLCVHEQDLKHHKGLHPHENISNSAFPIVRVYSGKDGKILESNSESLVKPYDQHCDSIGEETSTGEIQTDENVATCSWSHLDNHSRQCNKMTITNLHSEKHKDENGNFQNKSSQCIQTNSLVCPQAKLVLYPGEKQQFLHNAINVAHPGRATRDINPHKISNDISEDNVSKAPLELTTVPPTLPDPFHRDVLVVV